MKDKLVREYINKVLRAGIIIAAVLAVPGILFGGAWGNAAVFAVLLLPIARLLTEAVTFFKEGKPFYAWLSVLITVIILGSFTLSVIK